MRHFIKSQFAKSLAKVGLLAVTSFQFVSAQESTTTQFNFRHEPLTHYENVSMKEIADDFDPVSGKISLAVTDISLPGNNGLKVELRRKYEAGRDYGHLGNSTGEFGTYSRARFDVDTDLSGWSLDLPFIRGFYLKPATGGTHIEAGGFGDGEMCTGTTTYVSISTGQASTEVHPSQYWDGKLLHIPGETTEKFLRAVDNITVFNEDRTETTPQEFWGKQFTKSHHYISECTDIGAGNEGIKVKGPDGKTYTFNFFKDFMAERDPSRSQYTRKIRRMMMVTKIEDKFGNFVDYNYDAFKNLTSIVSNDGRRIDIAYELIPGKNYFRIDFATANGRTWDYIYDDGPVIGDEEGNTLIEVRLPNDKKWQYPNLTRLHADIPIEDSDLRNGWCGTNLLDEGTSDVRFNPAPPTHTFTIIDPDGLTTAYTTAPVYHGRYNVKTRIDAAGDIRNLFSYNIIGVQYKFRTMNCSDMYSLVKKEVSGPGIPDTYTWDYSYSQNWGHYDIDNSKHGQSQNVRDRETSIMTGLNGAFDIGIPGLVNLPANIANTQSIKTATVDGPDGKQVFYIDRDAYSISEDKVLATDYVDGTTLLKRQEFYYQAGTDAVPNVDYLGNDQLRGLGGINPYNNDAIATNHRKLEHRIKQANVKTYLYYGGSAETYDMQYSQFDVFGVPHLETGSNDFNSLTRYVEKGYQSNTDSWILSQPTRVRVSSDGTNFTNVSQTYYHSTTAQRGREELADLLVPFEETRYGRWVKRYTDYYMPDDFNASTLAENRAAGMVKSIEYNVKLGAYADGVATPGTANRFVNFSDYKRGKPQNVTFLRRYANAIDPNGTIVDTNLTTLSSVVDLNGWVTSITDLEGNTTELGYDLNGRILYADLPDSWLDRSYAWDDWDGTANHQQTRTVSHCQLNAAKNACIGNTRSYAEATEYDALLRPTSIQKSDTLATINRKQRFTYDAYNQLLTKSHWYTGSSVLDNITNTYDALRRLRTVTENGGGMTTHTYLPGNVKNVNNARGYDTTTTYQAYGQPSYDKATQIVAEIEGESVVTTDIDIDVLGLINTITQTGPDKAGTGTVSLTEYRFYDDRKRLCKTNRADVGMRAYGYNDIGEMTWSAEGALGGSNNTCIDKNTLSSTKVIDYTYDNFGEQYTVKYGDASPDLLYQMDGNGNLKSLIAGNVKQTYNYNSLNLLEDERLQIDLDQNGDFTDVDDKNYFIDLSYNAMGNLTAVTYPDSSIVDYDPNSFGEPTQAIRRAVQDGEPEQIYANTAVYHPNGIISSFTYGNQLVHTTLLHPTRQVPQSINDSSDSVDALEYTYTYDNNLNVKSITDGVSGVFSLTDLSYDGLDRLTSTTGDAEGLGSTIMNYDGLGNITGYTTRRNTWNYNYNTTSNRLTSVFDTNVASDHENNYLAFGYDFRGNIVNNGKRTFDFNRANQMTGSDGNTYLYDGHNRRVMQTDAKGTSYSMYGLDGTLFFRETQHGGINNIYLGKKLIAQDGHIPQNRGTQHHLPFGESIEGEKDAIGYTGHKFDRDLGLSYMQARYYDPVIGRFYSNDPVGWVADSPIHSFGRYTYGNNNPYKYTDPDGNFPFDVNSESRSRKEHTNGNIGGAIDNDDAGMRATADTLGKMTKQIAKQYVGAAALSAGGPALKATRAVAAPVVKQAVKTVQKMELIDKAELALAVIDGVTAFATPDIPNNPLNDGRLNGRPVHQVSKEEEAVKDHKVIAPSAKKK